MPIQRGMLGVPDQEAGDVVLHLRELLTYQPALRDDYKALVVAYWLAYDGLAAVLADIEKAARAYNCQLTAVDRFRAWFTARATSPKTIQNRAMEIQRAHPELDASPAVRAQRARQATQGPVR